MADFTLGTFDMDNVQAYDGFDRPNTATLVQVLSDGSDPSEPTQILQEGGVPMPQATIRGLTYDPADIVYLRQIRDSREYVQFTDCDGLSANVRVFDLTTERGSVGRRYYNLTLIAEL